MTFPHLLRTNLLFEESHGATADRNAQLNHLAISGFIFKGFLVTDPSAKSYYPNLGTTVALALA